MLTVEKNEEDRADCNDGRCKKNSLSSFLSKKRKVGCNHDSEEGIVCTVECGG